MLGSDHLLSDDGQRSNLFSRNNNHQAAAIMQTTNEFVMSPSPEDAIAAAIEMRKEKGAEADGELKLPPISTRRVEDDQHPPAAAAAQLSRKIRQDIFQ